MLSCVCSGLMKPACECYSVSWARCSVHLAKDFVSLSPTDINGLLYRRGITNTVAASLTDGESCGVYSSAGQTEEELGLQVKNRISSSRGRERAGCQGWGSLCPSSSCWLLPLQQIWLPLYQHSWSDPARTWNLCSSPLPGARGWRAKV